MSQIELQIIGHIHSVFPTKFGIPRQSRLTDSLESTITFEKEFRIPEMFRGLEEFSHIWLLWQFSDNLSHPWSPTVRPPRLGGNVRKGVFATRSPFRPNYIGLSAVRLLKVEETKAQGIILHVSGADLMDGTPILDIKPYLPITDEIPEAQGSFSDEHSRDKLSVICSKELIALIPENLRDPLVSILSQDPRPSYQNDPQREYGFGFDCFEVKFTVNEKTLTVTSIEKVR